MDIKMDVLAKCTLFRGFQEQDILQFIACMNPRKKSYEKGEFVMHAGEAVMYMYILLSGSVHIIEEDFWGNRSIIETMDGVLLFGEAYVFSNSKKYLVSVVVEEAAEILIVPPERMLESCLAGTPLQATLIRNIAYILSEKIVGLTQKVGHVIQRNTREKLLSYLSKCAKLEGKNAFCIPYSRQQLADYLSVERSALSHELSKMQKDGLVRYQKNYFELLHN